MSIYLSETYARELLKPIKPTYLSCERLDNQWVAGWLKDDFPEVVADMLKYHKFIAWVGEIDTRFNDRMTVIPFRFNDKLPKEPGY